MSSGGGEWTSLVAARPPAEAPRGSIATPVGRRPEYPGAAPPSPIAEAARQFGDDYPPVRGQWRLRLASVVLLASVGLYLPWVMRSLDTGRLWISVPFAAASLLTMVFGVLGVVNSWAASVPERRTLPVGREPLVGVLIPTCGEPVPMILRTVLSVLEQDWPDGRTAVIVSDDGHDPELEGALRGLGVTYYSPPPRDAPGRDGAAKAGNLNAALHLLDELHPGIRYVETRDADDEMGTTSFLREVVGQLEADSRLAFVQTIKEAQVSAGDPFHNREPMFYRRQMLARNAANAVFPCGSGVVWRREALRDIGEFPTWNLVEDLQSGVEALRRGWRGMYLPIVGAVAQHSPEDLPNVYKQRGTWAVDSVRLMVWGNLKGLGLRQRLHFAELLMIYLSAFSALVYIGTLAAAFLGLGPIRSGAASTLLHVAPAVVASELWLVIAYYPYNDRRARQRRYLQSIWQARTVWVGLAPVFAFGALKGVLGGPKHKPSYRVTRKTTHLAWHWRYVVLHLCMLVLLASAAIAGAVEGRLPPLSTFLPLAYWSGVHTALMISFIGRSWHGLGLSRDHAPVPATTHIEAAAA